MMAIGAPSDATHHIEMPCPGCGHVLRVRDKFVGHRVICRYCSETFEVSSPEALEPSSPRLSSAPEGCGGPCGAGIPGFDTLGLIRNGTMGQVFKACQTSVNRVVAVKVLHGSLSGRAEYVQRFRREATIASRLSHTNIPHLLDAGVLSDCPYLVMEYAEGETAQEHLDAWGAFDEPSTVATALGVAEALAHAHERGIIHRDVKPANVILTVSGGVKLIDFGLARPLADEEWATAEAGCAIGTPEYISPEQIRGQADLDARSDLYSLGVTLYQMLTGRVPYSGNSREILLQHADPRTRPDPPERLKPGLSTGVVAVIRRLLAKNREERYRSARDVVVDLARLLRGEPPVFAPGGCVKSPDASSGLDIGLDGVDGHDGRVDPEALVARARDLVRQGAFDRAVSCYTEAIRLEPGRARVLRERGDLLSLLKQQACAVDDYTEAMRIDPNDALAYVRRGTLCQMQGDYARARSDLYAAVVLAPEMPSARNRLAWLLATCPDPHHRDGKAAVAAATRACELSEWSDPTRIDTLAAAHAESGDFLAAVAWQQKALGQLPGKSPLRGAYLDRLKLYTETRPFREGPPSAAI